MDTMIQVLIDAGQTKIRQKEERDALNEKLQNEQHDAALAKARSAVLNAAKKFVPESLHAGLATEYNGYNSGYATVSVTVDGLAPFFFVMDQNPQKPLDKWAPHRGFQVAYPTECDLSDDYDSKPDPRYCVCWKYYDNDAGIADVEIALATALSNAQRFAQMESDAERKNAEWRAETVRAQKEREEQSVEQTQRDAAQLERKSDAAPEPTPDEIFLDAVREYVRHVIAEECQCQA